MMRLKLSHLVTKFKENNTWILYNWANTENIKISDILHPLFQFLEHIETNKYIDSCLLDSQDLKYLQEKLFLISSDEEIKNFIINEYNKANYKKLHLILMPVNQACNFNCVYCYEDHKQKHRMGDFEVNSLLLFIKNNKEIKDIEIDYFGGEPLLNPTFINTFNQKVINECEKLNINFSSSMTTNGYLLDKELFLKLLRNKVTNFQITIDGTEYTHNKLRPLINGKGTFHKIVSNLKEISRLSKDFKFLIVLRINFNASNSTKDIIESTINYLKEVINNDSRFVVHPHEIMNWKNEKGEQILYLSKKEASRKNDDFKEIIFKNKLNPFEIVNFSSMESNSCYAGKKISYVVFPASSSNTGNILPIKKCTVALSDKSNNIGFIDGNGDIVLNENFSKWTHDSPFRKDDCKKCFFILNCYGSSCPLGAINNQLIKCPEPKFHEIETVKDILRYIEDN